MCGLVGVMGGIVSDTLKKAFHDMLYLDVLRGEDSTGVAAISGVDKPKPEIELFKSLGSASDLFYEHSKFSKHKSLTHKLVNIYIGHNRYATQGKVIAENAHPFEFENVVGAHNGTLDMHSLRQFHGYKDLEVDSQIIYSHLSHTQSIDEVWKNAEGAMALVWYDKQTRKLNMIRNTQRPLFMAYTADDRAVFWASESWMILAAAYRHGIKLNDVIEAKPNRLYTFDMVKEGTFVERGRMFHVERDLPPFVPKPITTNYRQNYGQGYGRGWDDDYWDYFGLDKNGDKKEEPKAEEKPEPKKGTALSMRITEFHDLVMAPSAMGNLSDGREIRVNIPIGRYEDAKNKILNKTSQGYYVLSKMHRSALNPSSMWCNWEDCQWIALKPEFKLCVNAQGGFHIKKQETPTEYAPWHTPSISLTRAKYEILVEKGCGCCDRSAKWEDRNDLVWVDHDTYFCNECKDKEIAKEIIQLSKSA